MPATNMTPQAWVDYALAGKLVVDLGQLDATAIRALNEQVKAGKLARCRGSWSSMLIGPQKTIWAAPHAGWAPGQFDKVVEATDVFWAARRALEASKAEAA